MACKTKPPHTQRHADMIDIIFAAEKKPSCDDKLLEISVGYYTYACSTAARIKLATLPLVVIYIYYSTTHYVAHLSHVTKYASGDCAI